MAASYTVLNNTWIYQTNLENLWKSAVYTSKIDGLRIIVFLQGEAFRIRCLVFGDKHNPKKSRNILHHKTARLERLLATQGRFGGGIWLAP